MVWGWEVILCVNELGDLNSCWFGMRARSSICSLLQSVGVCKVVLKYGIKDTMLREEHIFKVIFAVINVCKIIIFVLIDVCVCVLWV